MCDFFKILLSFISGALLVIFGEVLRRWLLKSSVELSFEPNIGFNLKNILFVNTNQEDVMTKYIRVLAKGSSRIGGTAKCCKPFLTKIERYESDKSQYKVLHNDPIPLKWSHVGDMVLDIQYKMGFYFDVIEVNDRDNILKPQTTKVPVTWMNLLQERGRYRFTVMIAGDNIEPDVQSIAFEWKGSFDLLIEDSFKFD